MRHLAASLAAALLAVTACGGGDPPTGGGATTPLVPATLAVLGAGPVTTQYTSEVWAQNGYAYTTTWGRRGAAVGNSLYTWDVRGDAPALLSTTTVPSASTTGDVQVSDDGSLLAVATEFAPGTLALYSLADPARPVLVSQFSSPNTGPGVHTAELARVNGTLYAFLSVDPSNAAGFRARLVIVDLSNPAAPREVFAQPMGNPYVHDVYVRDGVLFTALWNDGLGIWDIGGLGKGGTVSAPVRVGTVLTAGGEAHNVWWYHDGATGAKRYAFVGQEGPGAVGSASTGDVHVVDVSDMTAPREVAFFNVPGAGTHNFAVDEASGVLYAAYYNAGVRALDVRGDLGACTASQKSADGRCDLGKMGRELARGLADRGNVYVWGVKLDGTSLYASDMLNGLWKLRALPAR